jgi:hypothetical protein
MKGKTKIVLCSMAIAGIAGFALATPTVGLLVGTILSSGTMNKHIEEQVGRPRSFGRDYASPNDFSSASGGPSKLARGTLPI